MEVGGKLLAALAGKQDVFTFFHAQLRPEYFVGEELQVFKWFVEHLKNYSVLPQVETAKAQFPSLPEAIEPIEYYLSKVELRFQHREINRTLYEASELMKQTKTKETFELLRNLVGMLTMDSIRRQMVDFGTEGAEILKDEYSKVLKNVMGVQFGWPTLDNMTMGMFPGDLVSIVGRPAMGKTYNLLYCAHHAFLNQQKNVVFLSMEMSPTHLIQRLGAIHGHVSVTDLKHGTLPNMPGYKGAKQLYQELLQLKDHPSKMWLIDGNLTSTPEELFGVAEQLKADMVYIDGAYLLQNENKRLDRFTRVAENTETIKKTASRLRIPALCSYQFRKPPASKKKTDDGEKTLDDIGYTDVVAQASSVVLGLFQDESVETLKSREITILKGREGAAGNFKIHWNFQKMDFSEMPKNEDIGQLDFM